MKTKLSFLLVACTLVVPVTRAQSASEPGAAPTLAPVDAATSSGGGSAGDAKANAAALAKTLANPIGALISVPFQNNFDFGGGPAGDGFQYKLNLQPIVPLTLNSDWLLISRTILPFVHQQDIIGTSSQTGLSDTVQSFFLSPTKPTEDGWIWGAGPVFLLPTATDALLGTEKWGVGPTLIMLKQENGWTYGALVNQIWSFAGASDRAEVSAMYLQPFVSYTTPKAMTFTLNTEATYDWQGQQWTMPLNVMVQQLMKIGGQPVALTVGYRYYADKPAGGPDWGLRFAVILLYPKK